MQALLLKTPSMRRKGAHAIFFRRGGTPQKGNALSACVTAFTPCPFRATADYISPLGLERSPVLRLRAIARAVFSAFLPTFPRSPRLCVAVRADFFNRLGIFFIVPAFKYPREQFFSSPRRDYAAQKSVACFWQGQKSGHDESGFFPALAFFRSRKNPFFGQILRDRAAHVD